MRMAGSMFIIMALVIGVIFLLLVAIAVVVIVLVVRQKKNSPPVSPPAPQEQLEGSPACPKCGATVSPEAKFCDKCGTELK